MAVTGAGSHAELALADNTFTRRQSSASPISTSPRLEGATTPAPQPIGGRIISPPKAINDVKASPVLQGYHPHRFSARFDASAGSSSSSLQRYAPDHATRERERTLYSSDARSQPGLSQRSISPGPLTKHQHGAPNALGIRFSDEPTRVSVVAAAKTPNAADRPRTSPRRPATGMHDEFCPARFFPEDPFDLGDFETALPPFLRASPRSSSTLSPPSGSQEQRSPSLQKASFEQVPLSPVMSSPSSPVRLVRTPTMFRTSFHRTLEIDRPPSCAPGGARTGLGIVGGMSPVPWERSPTLYQQGLDHDVENEDGGLSIAQRRLLGQMLPNGSQERLALESGGSTRSLASPLLRARHASEDGWRSCSSPLVPVKSSGRGFSPRTVQTGSAGGRTVSAPIPTLAAHHHRRSTYGPGETRTRPSLGGRGSGGSSGVLRSMFQSSRTGGATTTPPTFSSTLPSTTSAQAPVPGTGKFALLPLSKRKSRDSGWAVSRQSWDDSTAGGGGGGGGGGGDGDKSKGSGRLRSLAAFASPRLGTHRHQRHQASFHDQGPNERGTTGQETVSPRTVHVAGLTLAVEDEDDDDDGDGNEQPGEEEGSTTTSTGAPASASGSGSDARTSMRMTIMDRGWPPKGRTPRRVAETMEVDTWSSECEAALFART